MRTEQRELSCGELIKRLHDAMEKKANHEFLSQDVTLSQLKMLFVLLELSGGSATLKQLERYFGVSQSTAAGVAARLEKKKLIEGFTDPEDRRIKHVRITEAGRAVCWEAGSAMIRAEEWLLQALSKEECVQLQALLQKVYDAAVP